MNGKKSEPASVAAEDTARSNKSLRIIPRTLTNKQRVELVRKTFPDKYQGFNEPEASKGRHTSYTGLQYAEEIDLLLNASESRRNDFRRLNNRYTVRCDDALKCRLQAAKMTYGADCTNQEFIMTAILHECERIEGKRREVNGFAGVL